MKGCLMRKLITTGWDMDTGVVLSLPVSLECDFWTGDIDICCRALLLSHATSRLQGKFAFQLTPGALTVGTETRVSGILRIKEKQVYERIEVK